MDDYERGIRDAARMCREAARQNVIQSRTIIIKYGKNTNLRKRVAARTAIQCARDIERLLDHV